MTYVRTNLWWPTMLIYALGGAAIGLALPAMKTYAAAHLGRAGYAVFFDINILLPSFVVGIAAFYPRYPVALAGTFLATMAFLLAAGLGPALITPPLFRTFFQSLGPIATVACIAYHLLAIGTVRTVNIWRRVGSPPDPIACTNCGYKLIGLTEPRCPECAEPFDSQRITTLQKVNS